MKKWTRANFQPNLPLEDGRYITACKEHIALSKAAAAEGMVLLKNSRNLLPLKKGSKIALFGKGTFDYVKGGGGSGDVTTAYIRNLYEGFKLLDGAVEIFEPLCDYYREDTERQYAEGAVPGMTVEPQHDAELTAQARKFADTAIITISRYSGEGWDRSSVEYNNEYVPWDLENSMPKVSGRIFPNGDFELTPAEKTMIEAVKAQFDNIIVVLNIGGMIDTSWIKNEDKISSALIAWQGGMEGGAAAAEVLMGIVNPSGRLTDTFAARLEDYPSTMGFHEAVEYVDYTDDIYVGYRYFETIPEAAEKVCYPFGFGLSYTTFVLSEPCVCEENGMVKISIKVKNTGDCSGKEVVQVYTTAPQGRLGKPAKELRAFAKTKLLEKGEEQTLEMQFARNAMASYDDLGKIAKSAYVLEKGKYEIYVGTSVRDTVRAEYVINVENDEVTEQLTSKLAPVSLEKRMLPDGSFEQLPTSAPRDMNVCIFEKMIPGTEEAMVPAVRARERHMIIYNYVKDAKLLIDVAEGRASLDEFIAQLSDEDLIHLLGGQPNTGVANTFGIGSLPEYGVPNIMTADGPAGVRIAEQCGVCTTAWPCATALASTWNTGLVSQVGAAGGKELKENNLAVWLTPAMNIHRNPLCGRNFEYYSEDPLVTGKMAAAMTAGIQSQNVAATPKHFAANNKETNRKHSDSRVSERALREIYLKGFEIVVKEADPWSLMSSYNAVNGVRASENKELLEDILRGEWGFRGVVMSDWWNRAEHYKELLAGNDLKMACGYPDRIRKAMEMGAVTRADLERGAKRVLELILKID